jgi:PGF-CTERM protein
LLAGKVRTGERVRLTVDPTATEFDSQVTERVAFSIGDRTIDEREVTFGPRTETVTVEFDAPSTPGTYQLSASAVDADSPVQGFSRRLTVVDDVALARVENAAGDCSLKVTEIEFSGVYTADTEQHLGPGEVSEINPGDEVTYLIHALRNDECEGLPELPVTVGGERLTVLEDAMGTRQYSFSVTQTFGSPGTYDLEVKDTVLTEINVTADSTGTETESVETTEQTDSTEETSTTGDSSTDQTEDQTGGADEERQRTETTEGTPETAQENDSEGNSNGTSPGFGIGAALVGAVAGVYLFSRLD